LIISRERTHIRFVFVTDFRNLLASKSILELRVIRATFFVIFGLLKHFIRELKTGTTQSDGQTDR